MSPLLYLRTTLVASFIALAIVACSSGGGGTSVASSDRDPSSDPFVNNSMANQSIPQELLGDDVDADGIRDDLQAYIESTYAGDIDVMVRLKKLALVDQKILSSFHDFEAIKGLSEEYREALFCWFNLMPTGRDRTLAVANYSHELYNGGREEIGLIISERMKAIDSEKSVPIFAQLNCS